MIKADLTRFLCASLIVLAGCAQPRMVPPADVAKGEILEVKNRSRGSGVLVNEGFDLGGFKIAQVKRGWIHGGGSGGDDYSVTHATAHYSYQLLAGTRAWRGNCDMDKEKEHLKLGKGISVGSSEADLTCHCSDGTRAGKLKWTRSRDEKYAGSLAPGEQVYPLSPVTETDPEFPAREPAGYRFDGADGARGAVEMLRPGRIWFTERMPAAERESAACLLAGLMLSVEPAD